MKRQECVAAGIVEQQRVVQVRCGSGGCTDLEETPIELANKRPGRIKPCA
jgi:hypothetical protein